MSHRFNRPTLAVLLKAVPNLSGNAQATAAAVLFAEGFIKQFQAAGGQGVYAVVGMGDVHFDGGPLILATMRPDQNPDEVERLFNIMIQDATKTDDAAVARQLQAQRKGDIVLLGMKSTIARYTAGKPDSRADLLEPLAKLANSGSFASLVFCPGPDFRRVVRELWPQLPGVLAPMRGELADRWLSLEAAINLPPNINPRLALQAKDAESAEIFAKLWRDLPTATTEFGDDKRAARQVKGYAQLLVDTLPAKVNGTRVDIGFPTEASQFLQLGSMLSEAADKSMEICRAKERMSRFKQIRSR